jgi:glycosyltransferase involved in cell wall biosynthesis
MRRLERRARVRTDAVIAENRFAADWAVSVNPKLKYAVIPHVIAKEFLVSDSSYGQRIVFIGSLNTNKRPDMVARAFASIAGDHPHAELVIIGNGSGDIIGRINDLIRHKELGGRIRLTGALSRREVIMELSGSCCLVSASIMDTSPNVITEAHACGVPVVATRIGGIPEMVADGVDGFLVDVDDEEAMARYMSLLLFDRSLSEQMGKRGKIKVTELNIAQNVIRSYVDFLRSLKGYKIEERKMK